MGGVGPRAGVGVGGSARHGEWYSLLIAGIGAVFSRKQRPWSVSAAVSFSPELSIF